MDLGLQNVHSTNVEGNNLYRNWENEMYKSCLKFINFYLSNQTSRDVNFQTMYTETGLSLSTFTSFPQMEMRHFIYH